MLRSSRKGTDLRTDGYSGFAGTDLAERLHRDGIRRIFIGGLATDYCVKATALEAKNAGFDVVVLTDAVAAVNVAPVDEGNALREMEAAGVMLGTSDDIAGRVKPAS